MSQQQNTDIENLYNGKVRWIKVPFSIDPVWLSDDYKSYTDQILQYHTVPALMTYCELTKSEGPITQAPLHITYSSKVLLPIKWVIHFDHDGLPAFNGNETGGSYTITMATKKKVTFHSSVEFATETSISGGYGSVQGSVGLKSSIGASWVKEVEVATTQSFEVEQGCNYQFTRFYAKLLCEVIHARKGGFFCDDSAGLVLDNAPGASPYIVPVAKLRGLYNAFGKNVSLRRQRRLRSSVPKINAVVDPADGRLYITSMAINGPETKDVLPNINQDPSIGDTGLFSVAYNQPLNRCPYYFPLNGTDDTKENMEITYAPGNLVKVWEMAVKARK
ncbi:hypothetical protein BGZ90_007590 [Linnemannia elongata]|nr:hypothetical protein BGZ90_007590 [Linnemannia elongata]